MNRFTQDDIYGLSLKEYADRHNKSIDDIINSVKIDIDILSENLENIGDIMNPLSDSVYFAREKKKKHLERLTSWD